MAKFPQLRNLSFIPGLVFLFSFTRQEISADYTFPRFPPSVGRTLPASAGSGFYPPPFHPSVESAINIFGGMESDILRLVNQHRRSMGLKSLQMNTLESTLARQHSQNMASGKTPFGHDGFKDRAAYLNKKMGPIRLAAENVASGQMSAREVVDGWLNSPGHRRNIEGDFRLTGIGLARGGRGMIYFTQIFTR